MIMFLLEVIGTSILFIIVMSPFFFTYFTLNLFIRRILYSFGIDWLTRQEKIALKLIKITEGFSSDAEMERAVVNMPEPYENEDDFDNLCMGLEIRTEKWTRIANSRPITKRIK